MESTTNATKTPEEKTVSQPRLIEFSRLSGEGMREVLIELHGMQYRLRKTRHGKLILTK